MSKSQRTKGAAGEREWCAFLAEHGFPGAKRVLGQAREGGGDVPLPPVLYEVKRRKGIAVYEWLTQAETALANEHTQAQRGEFKCFLPAVAARADGKPWIVILPASDFLRILKAAPSYSGYPNA